MHGRPTSCHVLAAAWLASVAPVLAIDDAKPTADTVMRALTDELERSMRDLVIEGLPKPYFIQYNAQDRRTLTLQAGYGAIVRADQDRMRFATSRVRVGSYALDNTNIGRGFGGRTSLPLDDDYTAIRHAVWQMTDSDYKGAVEQLARKHAYLRQKEIEDRPDDFSSAEPVQFREPPVDFAFDRGQWEQRLKAWSERFGDYPKIQDSDVILFAGLVTEWIVNSEGTRLRKSDTGLYVRVEAELQADDGMPLSDKLTYIALKPDQLPAVDRVLADIDTMCKKLIELSGAPRLELYTGPVLFDPVATGQAFDVLLGDGLCARPEPLGSGGADDTKLENKIGRRILPRSFQVYDDPGPERFKETLLAGAYTYDDEAVKPQRVSLVESGILKTLLASRAPTKKIKHTTGHGRSRGFGDAQATVGCLYVADELGMSADQLKEELLEAVRDEGLDFGLRIESMKTDGFGDLGEPIYAYKVHVDDGREELVRGLRFLPVQTRALRHIIAAGKEREVYNVTSGNTSSFITPAVIFEELELTKIDREFDKLPILKSPVQRTD